MIRRKYFFTVLMLFCYALSPAYAQENIKIVSQDTLSRSMKDLLNESASRVFHDPDPPRFVMMDNKEKFLFGMGGYVSCLAYYDGTGFLSRDMINASIPMSRSTLRSDRFSMDASGSRLFFKLLGDTRYGKIHAYIEAGFTGSGNAFSLKHAYVEIRGLLIGQTWSNIMDLDASPATVDGEGPCGLNGLRQPQIRYEWEWTNGWQTSVSLEDPDVTMLEVTMLQASGDVTVMGQRFPDLIGSVRYKGKNWHLRLAGVIRFMDKQKGYGGAFSGHYDMTEKDVFRFQATCGAGIGHYIQDLSGVGYDVYLKPDMSFGRVGALGWYGAYEHHWTPGCFSGAVYSQVHVKAYENAPGFFYRTTHYAGINTFWQLFKYGQAGIEVLYGDRVNHNRERGYAWRLNCLLRYNF